MSSIIPDSLVQCITSINLLIPLFKRTKMEVNGLSDSLIRLLEAQREKADFIGSAQTPTSPSLQRRELIKAARKICVRPR